MATKEEAIANINSVKSTSASEKAAAIKALDSFYPKQNTNVNTNNTNNTNTNSSSSNSSSNLLSSIQSKLLEQSGIISSTNSNLEQRLNNAISGVRESATKSNQVVESQFGRELGYQLDKSNTDMINGRAAGAGGLMNMAALRELTQTTDKSLKDLEQRKNELILQNDSAAASKIADLQIKALEFQQNANQQVFQNLLGIADFGFKQSANELAKSNQVFQQNQAMSTIALKYGIPLNPGDTIESITTRAMPFASKEEALQLAKLQSEINKNNAEVTKTLREGISYVNDSNLDTVAQAAAINPAVLSTIKNPSDLGKVVVKMNEIQKANAISQIEYNIKSGVYKTKEQALSDIQTSASNGTLNPSYIPDAVDYVNTNFVNKPKEDKPSNFDLLMSKVFSTNVPGWYQTPDGKWKKLGTQ